MTEDLQPLTKEEVVDYLTHARDDWSDEIPAQMIHSDAQNNKFKVRKNWFVGVSAMLSNVLDENVIKNPEPTKKSDIDKANGIIDEVLRGL